MTNDVLSSRSFVTLSDGASVHVVTDVDNERQDTKC